MCFEKIRKMQCSATELLVDPPQSRPTVRISGAAMARAKWSSLARLDVLAPLLEVFLTRDNLKLELVFTAHLRLEKLSEVTILDDLILYTAEQTFVKWIRRQHKSLTNTSRIEINFGPDAEIWWNKWNIENSRRMKHQTILVQDDCGEEMKSWWKYSLLKGKKAREGLKQKVAGFTCSPWIASPSATVCDSEWGINWLSINPIHSPAANLH